MRCRTRTHELACLWASTATSRLPSSWPDWVESVGASSTNCIEADLLNVRLGSGVLVPVSELSGCAAHSDRRSGGAPPPFGIDFHSRRRASVTAGYWHLQSGPIRATSRTSPQALTRWLCRATHSVPLRRACSRGAWEATLRLGTDERMMVGDKAPA